MPYKSRAQQAFLHAKKPEIAKRFDEETPKSAYKKLPEHYRSKDKNRFKDYEKRHRRKENV